MEAFAKIIKRWATHVYVVVIFMAKTVNIRFTVNKKAFLYYLLLQNLLKKKKI